MGSFDSQSKTLRGVPWAVKSQVPLFRWLKYNYHVWQIMIGHLGHFLLEFFGQIWTGGTLKHIIGPILVIFEICQFLTIPGPFEYFSENGWSQKIKFFWMKEWLLPPYQKSKRLRWVLWAVESGVPLFWHFDEGLKCTYYWDIASRICLSIGVA